MVVKIPNAFDSNATSTKNCIKSVKLYPSIPASRTSLMIFVTRALALLIMVTIGNNQESIAFFRWISISFL